MLRLLHYTTAQSYRRNLKNGAKQITQPPPTSPADPHTPPRSQTQSPPAPANASPPLPPPAHPRDNATLLHVRSPNSDPPLRLSRPRSPAPMRAPLRSQSHTGTRRNWSIDASRIAPTSTPSAAGPSRGHFHIPRQT